MSPALLTDAALELAAARVNLQLYRASWRGDLREVARLLVERAWVEMRWRDRFPVDSRERRCWHGLMLTDLISASRLADRILGRSSPEPFVPPELALLWE